VIRRTLDWLDDRSGWRRARTVLLDEPLPPGTGWFFTVGSVLLALLGVQVLTGAFLTLYYAPTPDHAYDSVRFIGSTFAGTLVRGLHHYGASFIVVAVVFHTSRVVVFASYKRPRELTWISGILLLLILLGFALTGYLLPWDQRAYWATVVTINISRLTPFAGDAVASALQGGTTVGALTLTRWYAVHIIFLPAILIALVTVHLVMMRRHGISGPIRARTGPEFRFFPSQAARDVTVVGCVLTALTAIAWHGAPELDAPADPADATYIPRPEWYFLGLFQLLKYFPGRWEVIGALILPGVAVALLMLLPWIDRSPDRDPRRRRLVMTAATIGLIGIASLTALGWRDRPATLADSQWSMREIGGRMLASTRGCARCHNDTGLADPLEEISTGRGPEWIAGHVTDPEMIAPGLREPPAVITDREAAAIVAYVHQLSRQPYPGFPPHIETASTVFARFCVGCHKLDGDGGTDGPDLTHAGSKHDLRALRLWIIDPEAVNPEAEMPGFARKLSAAELDAIAGYLAARK
jgi:quinol-cytochrome oxidoreductase complex cytochrome b subunit/cytochrome c553